MIDDAWERARKEGRKAFKRGKGDADCPYQHGRLQAAWLTGRMEALAETDEAADNERKSLRDAVEQAVDNDASSELLGELFERLTV